jgi:hypothetical protein
MIVKPLSFFVCSCLFVLAPSFAQDVVDGDKSKESMDQVKISALRDPELRSYSQLLKGLKVYNDQRSLAPESELFFILIPKSKSANLRELKMRLASDETSVDIPVDSSGQFKLPFIETKSDDEYDLILNIPKGQFLIRPYVKSANLPLNTKRFGDFRLECQVRWAIEKQDVSLVFSTYVKLLASGNPCTSRTVDVGFYAPYGVDTISFDTAKQKLFNKVNSYERFSLPLWNKDLEDSVLVKFGRIDNVSQP